MTIVRQRTDGGKRTIFSPGVGVQPLSSARQPFRLKILDDEEPDRCRLPCEILQGNYGCQICRPGMLVHTSDTCPLRDLTTEVTISPGATIFIILEGEVELLLGKRRLRLGAGGTTPTGHVLSFQRPTRVIRRVRDGVRLRKVLIRMAPDWFAAAGLDFRHCNPGAAEFLDRNGACFTWKPTKRAQSLSEQILNPLTPESALENMLVESRAIELAAEALSQVAAEGGTTGAPCAPGNPIDPLKAQRIRDEIIAGLSSPLPLRELARQFGMSPASLQRFFKANYGKTVAEFIREQRLIGARDALRYEGMSVSQAAYLAGYSTPANFATAFKRAFGISPSDIRR